MLLSVGGLGGATSESVSAQVTQNFWPGKEKLSSTNPSKLLTSLHGLFSLTFRRYITLQTHRVGRSDICNTVFPRNIDGNAAKLLLPMLTLPLIKLFYVCPYLEGGDSSDTRGRSFCVFNNWTKGQNRSPQSSLHCVDMTKKSII